MINTITSGYIFGEPIQSCGFTPQPKKVHQELYENLKKAKNSLIDFKGALYNRLPDEDGCCTDKNDIDNLISNIDEFIDLFKGSLPKLGLRIEEKCDGCLR